MIEIDRYTGSVDIQGVSISSSTKPCELPSSFSRGQTVAVGVGRNRVFCQFLSYTVFNVDLRITIDLRFENEVLVSLFFYLEDLARHSVSDEDYYASVPERKSLHKRWLQSQLGEKNSNTGRIYAWGKIGVAQDRSERVYVFLHNQNNTWA